MILCLATLLNLLISTNSFFVWNLYIFLYVRLCYLEIEIVLLLHFSEAFDFFLLLAKLLWLESAVQCWKEVARVDILILFMMLGRGRLSVLQHLVSYIVFLYQVEEFPFHFSFLDCFYHAIGQILPNVFSAPEIVMGFSTLLTYSF